MFCSECGEEQVGDPRYCRNCGADLSAPVSAPGSVIASAETHAHRNDQQATKVDHQRIAAVILGIVTLLFNAVAFVWCLLSWAFGWSGESLFGEANAPGPVALAMMQYFGFSFAASGGWDLLWWSRKKETSEAGSRLGSPWRRAVIFLILGGVLSTVSFLVLKLGFAVPGIVSILGGIVALIVAYWPTRSSSHPTSLL